MLTIHITTMMVLTIVESIGYQICRTNMVALHNRTNVQNTETKTLKVVNLLLLLVCLSRHLVSEYARLGPDEGDLGNRPVIGVGVEDLQGRRVEAIVRADLPEVCPEEIGVGDAKEGQCCHGPGQLNDEQGVEQLGYLPFPGEIWEPEHPRG